MYVHQCYKTYVGKACKTVNGSRSLEKDRGF